MTAREKLEAIQSHLATPGNKVLIATALKATMYGNKHVAMFKATDRNLFVQRGKHWDCIDYCSIRFGKETK